MANEGYGLQFGTHFYPIDDVDVLKDLFNKVALAAAPENGPAKGAVLPILMAGKAHALIYSPGIPVTFVMPADL
jgi:hypothetical protein